MDKYPRGRSKVLEKEKVLEIHKIFACNVFLLYKMSIFTKIGALRTAPPHCGDSVYYGSSTDCDILNRTIVYNA